MHELPLADYSYTCPNLNIRVPSKKQGWLLKVSHVMVYHFPWNRDQQRNTKISFPVPTSQPSVDWLSANEKSFSPAKERPDRSDRDHDRSMIRLAQAFLATVRWSRRIAHCTHARFTTVARPGTRPAPGAPRRRRGRPRPRSGVSRQR